MATTAGRAAPTVVRTIGTAAAASIAISNMVGQGVFLKARVMLCNVPSPSGMLGAWLVAGLLALCGALTLAELGAAMPESGGLYAFFRRAYGESIAFAYGWMIFFIASPASIAALAVGAAIFFNISAGHALDRITLTLAIGGLRPAFSGTQFAAIVIIGVVTAINCAPAVVNGRIATVLASVKIAMLVAVTFAAFALRDGAATHYAASATAGSCAGVAASTRGGVAGFAAAVIGALYAYNGWHSLTLVGGEVKRPGRTFPVALIWSVVLVIVLYVAANAAFVNVLSPVAIASLEATASVGVTVVETLFGSTWRLIAAGLLFASVAATLHVTVLTNARVTFALARDGLGFAPLAHVSRRGRVPVNAVLTNSAIATLLVTAGSFDALSDYLIFNAWVFFVAAGGAVFVLRRRPGEPHPFLAAGYPFVPAAYVAVGAWLVVQTLASSPGASLIGLGIVALSFPVYYARRRKMA